MNDSSRQGAASAPAAELFRVTGLVQGVGFRPFVHRAARTLGLRGWVRNDAAGALILAAGPAEKLDALERILRTEAPPPIRLDAVLRHPTDEPVPDDFCISASDAAGAKTAQILPDLATCPDCLRELFDPADRRHLYPFINCTRCGPRYSIVERLPYDRPHTTMRDFVMCPKCRAEYEAPSDRRFHAQPNACPVCGPQLTFLDAAGAARAERHEALRAAAETIRAGQIVAVKGIGGFHLLADARNEEAVRRLRARKRREEKPLALMYPGLTALRADCETCAGEEQLLTSPAAPIVLLRRRPQARVADSVAPRNPWLGAMLPYAPLHHLLLRELDFAVVATSGNLSDEPICTDEQEAVVRLAGMADAFLVHNRPIARPVDDSVVRWLLERPLFLRRSRGYAPFEMEVGGQTSEIGGRKSEVGDQRPEVGIQNSEFGILHSEFSLHHPPLAPNANNAIRQSSRQSSRQSLIATPTTSSPSPINHQPSAINHSSAAPLLAVGAHLKNTVAIARGGRIWLSQHVGDLDTLPARQAFENAIETLIQLHEIRPARIVCDQHPDYASTHYARATGLPVTAIQHHHAHVAAGMADNRLTGGVLGVAWDGTGHGPDASVWGGEFLWCDGPTYRRAAHFLPFRLPGGERAVREPRRSALGVLHAMNVADDPRGADSGFDTAERRVLAQMLRAGTNSPWTSSVGRLFDAAAALLGLRQVCAFEGQAAMELEFAAEGHATDEVYPFEVRAGDGADAPLVVDWRPLFAALLTARDAGTPVGLISARFHRTLTEIVRAVGRRLEARRVVLTGGCFQNVRLLTQTVQALQRAQCEAYWPRDLPPNDGAIAAGQAFAAMEQESGFGVQGSKLQEYR